VLIGLASDGLSIQDVRRDVSGDPDQVQFRITKIGLRAERWVYAHEGHGFDGLTAFFKSMCDDWRGWAGEREWVSLEHDLRLVGRHDGHVRLSASLRQPIDWQVTAELTLDPGEQLSAAARDLADLLS
jgi:hypothetical protein